MHLSRLAYSVTFESTVKLSTSQYTPKPDWNFSSQLWWKGYLEDGAAGKCICRVIVIETARFDCDRCICFSFNIRYKWLLADWITTVVPYSFSHMFVHCSLHLALRMVEIFLLIIMPFTVERNKKYMCPSQQILILNEYAWRRSCRLTVAIFGRYCCHSLRLRSPIELRSNTKQIANVQRTKVFSGHLWSLELIWLGLTAEHIVDPKLIAILKAKKSNHYHCDSKSWFNEHT